MCTLDLQTSAHRSVLSHESRTEAAVRGNGRFQKVGNILSGASGCSCCRQSGGKAEAGRHVLNRKHGSLGILLVLQYQELRKSTPGSAVHRKRMDLWWLLAVAEPTPPDKQESVGHSWLMMRHDRTPTFCNLSAKNPCSFRQGEHRCKTSQFECRS